MRTQLAYLNTETLEITESVEAPPIEKKVELRLIKGKRRGIKAGTTVCVIFLFAVFFIIISRYSQMTKLNYEIADIKKEINEINAINSALAVELDQKTNMIEMRYNAQRELGMSEPDANQVIYIEVPRANNVVVPATSSTNDKKPVGIMDSIRGFVTGSL
jgi:cell division protein FtsL